MAILVQFPHTHSNWAAIEASLKRLAESKSADDGVKYMAQAYYAFKLKEGKADISKTPFNGLNRFLQKIDDTEKKVYSKKAFPMIGKLALESSQLVPEDGLEVIREGQAKTVTLSRHFVASIVALGFLNLFDDDKLCDIDGQMLSMPSVNFEAYWFQLSKSQLAKARMILNYFTRLAEEIPKGNITYRRIIPESELVAAILLKSEDNFCPFVAKHDGTIEDAGPNVLQMDFANQFLGGGVLLQGRVQEEIRFSVCPELLSSMLFIESMAPREAVIIEGFEQYAAYSGYGNTLGYAGDYKDPYAAPDKKGANGEILTTLSAIDAVPYTFGAQEQFQRSHISRDIHKAYAGFLQPYAEKHKSLPQNQDDPEWLFKLDPSLKRTIATGNWGCGAFRGDPQLKAMLQWMAASKAECPAIVYYTFGDERVKELGKIVSAINEKGWVIKDLMGVVLSYCEKLQKEEFESSDVDLFDFIQDAIKEA